MSALKNIENILQKKIDKKPVKPFFLSDNI